MRKFIILIFLLLFNFIVYGITNTASTGNWSNNSTWSLNRTPISGDTIIIPVNATVTINSNNLNISGSPVVIFIYGKLDFGNSGKLTLPGGSIVEIKSGGSILKGNGNGSNNIINIGNVEVWKASCGDISIPVRFDGTFNSDTFCATLALEIIYFDLKNVDDKISIQFHIVNNGNISLLAIQKSYDLNTWEYVYIWYSPMEQIFIYNDELNTNKKYTYYRLIQIENNQDTFYSNVKVVNNLDLKSVEYVVINNYLHFTFLNDTTVVYLFDINGKYIATITKDTEIFLNNGIYFLKTNSYQIDDIKYEKILINSQ